MKRILLLALPVLFLGHSKSADAQEDAPQNRAILLQQSEIAPVSEAIVQDIMTPFQRANIPFAAPSNPASPTNDAMAQQMARATNANVVVILRTRVQPPVRIRGTALIGQQSELAIRILTTSGNVVYDKSALANGYGTDSPQAIEQAQKSALQSLLSSVANTVQTHWSQTPTPPTWESRDIAVTGAHQWQDIGAILRQLSAVRSIHAIHILSMRNDAVKMRLLGGPSSPALVASLRRTRLPDGEGQISVRLIGNAIAIGIGEIPNT